MFPPIFILKSSQVSSEESQNITSRRELTSSELSELSDPIIVSTFRSIHQKIMTQDSSTWRLYL